MAQYIVRNRHGNTYHCRLKVPIALRRAAGFSEIRRSLHTTDRSDALIRARQVRVVFDAYIAKLLQMKWTEEELHKHHQALIDDINTATRLVAEHSPEVAARLSPDDLLELADEIRARQAIEDHQVVNKVLDSISPYKEQQQQLISTTPQEPTLLTLAKERLKVLNQNEDRKEASRRSKYLKSAMEHWENTIGDIPLSQLTANMIKEFADKMTEKGITPGEIIDRIRAMKRMLDKNETNRGKYLHGANPFNEIDIKRPPDGRKENQKRECFTSAEINAIFDQASKFPKDDYRHWMPLLGAYTGARNGEIFFLTAEAIQQCEETGIWYLEFKNEFAANGVKFRSVKNDNSARCIPIHSSILEKGFIDFISKFEPDQLIFWPTERLSTTIKSSTQHENYGKNSYTKMRRDVLEPSGVYKANVKTFYSFRHTVINQLYRKNVELKHIQALVGHLDNEDKEALSGITHKHYIKEQSNLLAQLAEIVNLINYYQVED